jgi:hypothetical protein
MKPRLEVAPLTEEDSYAWHWVCLRHDGGPFSHFVWLMSENADRRDANLMFELARWKHPQTSQCIQRMTDWSDKCLREGRPG